MILAKKVRIYPTKKQENKLWQSVGVARFIYNWTIEREEESYLNGNKFIKNTDLRKELTLLKQNKFNWLYTVSNNVAKQAVKDACNSYINYFNGLTNKPKFKSKKKSKPSFYNDPVKLKVKSNEILLEKIGWVKIKANSLPMNTKYSNPRISFDNKYWYISVGIERESLTETLNNEILGIDLGIKHLAICSNNVYFPNINKTTIVKKLERRLSRLNRKFHKKYKLNKNYFTNRLRKLQRKIRLLYRRLKNIRTNYIHQITNKIVRTKPSKIIMEHLNIKGMMKKHFIAKAFAEQALYEFKRQMIYKCKLHGITFIEADKFFPSSKICSNCGNINYNLKLSNRIYKCSCGLVIDRDLNAAINLSRYQEN